MKIIDLLNKIANDEEVPKYIKYNGWGLTYDRQPCDYYCEEYGNLFEYLINEKRTIECLNYEVEVIEDNKKIEHIGKKYDITDFKREYPKVAELIKDLNNKQYEIIDKLNEVINNGTMD